MMQLSTSILISLIAPYPAQQRHYSFITYITATISVTTPRVAAEAYNLFESYCKALSFAQVPNV